MIEDIQQLARSCFGKNSIEECSLQELQNAVREYPYSAPLQLILSEKMRSQHPSLYQKQLQKTSLYFHNILWFDYLVNQEEYIQEDFIIAMSSKKTLDGEFETEDTLFNKDNGSQKDIEVMSDDIGHESRLTEPGIHLDESSQQIKVEDQIESHVFEARNEIHERPQTIDETGHQPEQTQEEPSEQKPSSLAETPVREEENVTAFEPFHTVDYFASQGIKLTLDEKPKDRFGQQLKSFTEWLKTMKRLPQTEIVKNLETGSEQKVQTLAEHSLHEPEVVTEAMAEVWEKQGNYQKAADVYAKLSLLNPSKSVYFAAKIEQLKKGKS